ncbi:hypothetical protein MJG53_002401 [Ovis ammon polii x Ovis aries]|uniref:Uncharacterized protein n=1 Tax=Ovis ammon polii x Ovis aries TaxID=2918886 RepID=A0ACB9VED2_9CETA|nr:hypothetical protein MJG53_002401 [Ovis ammon polii x Ovis aries]
MVEPQILPKDVGEDTDAMEEDASLRPLQERQEYLPVRKRRTLTEDEQGEKTNAAEDSMPRGLDYLVEIDIMKFKQGDNREGGTEVGDADGGNDDEYPYPLLSISPHLASQDLSSRFPYSHQENCEQRWKVTCDGDEAADMAMEGARSVRVLYGAVNKERQFESVLNRGVQKSSSSVTLYICLSW